LEKLDEYAIQGFGKEFCDCRHQNQKKNVISWDVFHIEIHNVVHDSGEEPERNSENQIASVNVVVPNVV
jgi:hypothetical protein